MNDIAHRLERITEIFKRAQQISYVEEDLTTIIEHLDSADFEFRSIAYEGASMGLGLRDLAEGADFPRWRYLMEGPGADHNVQVHLGLGWAFANRRISPSAFIKTLDPLLSFRIWDGWGHYDGIMRSRLSINSHKRSEEIQEKYFHAYDRGLGRSLWYRCKGDYTQISDTIAGFSAERHQDLWMGIGTACTYIGGFEEITLKELASSAAGHHLQLAKGTVMAAMTRIQAKTHNPYTEMACRIWCNCSATEAMQITLKAEPSFALNPDCVFEVWLSQIEFKLQLLQ